MTTDEVPLDLSRHRPGRLRGQGVVLRPWQSEDAPAMVAIFDDPDVALRTPLPAPFTPADAEERLRRAMWPDRLLLAVTTDGGAPLGEVLLTAGGELGYAIGRAHRGRGLATRALVVLRDHAHDAVGIPVLHLRIEAENRASTAVAERAGFALDPSATTVVEHRGRRCVLDTWRHTSATAPRPAT